MKNIGIQLDSDYDLKISPVHYPDGTVNYGLTIGEVTYQNQAMLLLAQKGEYKEHPTVGIGINDICNDNNFALWKREITEQMEADGQRISKLVIDEKGLAFEAKYI